MDQLEQKNNEIRVYPAEEEFFNFKIIGIMKQGLLSIYWQYMIFANRRVKFLLYLIGYNYFE